MTVDLRGAAYAASRISSTLKGSTKQFGWLQAPATKLLLPKELRRTPQPSELCDPKRRVRGRSACLASRYSSIYPR